jgi:hypothetical protein
VLLTIQTSAARLDALLSEVQSLLDDNKTLAGNSSFLVKEKNAGDKARLANLMLYAGPDPDTVGLLEQNIEHWMADPEYFWKAEHRKVSRVVASMYADPQVGIVSLYLDLLDDDI